MADLIKAVFEHGHFVPDPPYALPEGTKVLLAVQPAGGLLPPPVSDAGRRAEMLQTLVDRMKRNPLPASARRFSRDEMHDRP